MIKSQNPLATFLFDTKGAKRKVNKRETPFWRFRPLQEEEVASNFPYASHTATRAGNLVLARVPNPGGILRHLTSQAFKKA